jgi:flagellar FliL protein
MSEAGKTKKDGKEAKGGKGGNLFKIIIIVFLAIILVAGAAFAGYYVATKNNDTTAKHSTEGAASVVTNVTEAYFLAVEEKLVNLADADGKRFAKMTITIAYDIKNKKVAAELTEKTDVIVDAINNIIRNKKAADFNGKGAEDIKREILERVNSLIKTGRATNVYYKDILIQ